MHDILDKNDRGVGSSRSDKRDEKTCMMTTVPLTSISFPLYDM